MHMYIGADVVPTFINQDLFLNGDVENLIGKELVNKLHDADFIAMNLEVPLTNTKAPISKCGPNLIAPVDSINAIKKINPYFFTLANNHIMDQGIDGLLSTCKILSQNGISYCGVGKNINNIKKGIIKEIKGIKVGLYCCAEHEFSIATIDRPGANPYDPLDSFDFVQTMKKECDYLIVLYHGGKEFYRYPSPQLQRIFHKFSDYGANLVVAQHTHCVGCKEIYNGSTLIYGQGNFLFNKKNNEFWNSSLLISIEIDDKGRTELKYLPIEQTEKGIQFASGVNGDNILEGFRRRSQEIEDPSFVISNYEKFAEQKYSEYIVALAGNRLSDRVKRKIIGNNRMNKTLQGERLNRILNFVECESHIDLIRTGMRNHYKF